MNVERVPPKCFSCRLPARGSPSANGHANCAIKQMVNRCNTRIDLPDMADEVILSGVPGRVLLRAGAHDVWTIFAIGEKGETLVLVWFSEIKSSERRANAGV